jgi:hypothetical protein
MVGRLLGLVTHFHCQRSVQFTFTHATLSKFFDIVMQYSRLQRSGKWFNIQYTTPALPTLLPISININRRWSLRIVSPEI